MEIQFTENFALIFSICALIYSISILIFVIKSNTTNYFWGFSAILFAILSMIIGLSAA